MIDLAGATAEEYRHAIRLNIQELACCCLQSLAALLSDGSVAVFAAAEQDFWGEGDDAAAAVEADDGADSEALLQPQRCVSVIGGQAFWH
jgi:hypothetical protein